MTRTKKTKKTQTKKKEKLKQKLGQCPRQLLIGCIGCFFGRLSVFTGNNKHDIT